MTGLEPELAHVHPNRDGETDVRPWRPEDGDLRCQNCGRPNVAWYTDHDTWNRVMPDDGILCIGCFIERAEMVMGVAAWGVFGDSAPFRAEFRRGFEAGRSTRTALPAGEQVPIVRGWRIHADGSRSPIERWVKHANGDWVSLDSERRTSGDILMDTEHLSTPGRSS